MYGTFWRYWSEIKVTFNGKVINLPKSIAVKIWDKFKIRHMMGGWPIFFHLMLKQGINWFMLTQKEQETESIKQVNLILQKNGKGDQPGVQLLWFYAHKVTHSHSRCRINY